MIVLRLNSLTRRVGVMTKPDTIPPGARNVRENWLAVIEGHRHTTKLGYYCTRQPDDDERARGITVEQARLAEKEFFAKTAPWSTSSAQDRFGTGNLVSSLSRLLAKIIDDSSVALVSRVLLSLTHMPPNQTTKDSKRGGSTTRRMQ